MQRIDAEFTTSGGGETPPPAGNNASSDINYNYTGSGVEFWINESRFDVENATPGIDNTDNSGSLIGNISYNYDDSGNVTLDLETLFITRITSLVVNGTEYANNADFPKTPNQILEAINGQCIHYSIRVPYSATYTISTITTDNIGDYMVVGNFLWSYQEEDKDTDDYVGNGTLELVNVEYNNVEYTEEQMEALNKGYMQWDQSSIEGGAMFPAGAELTVKLMPDAGYQLTSFTINGGEFDAGDDVGIYTFEVPKGNFHLGAHFTAVEDSVNSDNSNAVSSGSITLGGTESSMGNGTARLDVKDVNLTSSQISSFENAAGDYKISNYLDISLYNTIYKGSVTDTWDDQVTELDHNATITLQLTDDVNGNEVAIVHEKHDGTYEVIETTYNENTNTISFTTNSFSNYAIATKTSANVISSSGTSTDGGSVGSAATEINNPTTGDNITSFATLFGLATIGAFITIKKGIFNGR